MADRFRVLNGNWDLANSWSTTSGGSGGASVPTSTDDVYFDANTPNGEHIINANCAVYSIDFTGFTGTLSGGSSYNLSIYGSTLTLGSGMTNNFEGIFHLVDISKSLTFNGIAINRLLIQTGSPNTTTLQDKLTFTYSSTTNYTLGKAAGIFDINGQDIEFTGDDVLIFSAALSFYNLIKTSIGSLKFLAGNTYTIENNIQVNGNSSTKQSILSSTAGTPITLHNSTGAAINLEYCDIKDVTATGDDWYAEYSTDSGGNTGIIFKEETISKPFCYDKGNTSDNAYKSVNISITGTGLDNLIFYIGEDNGAEITYTQATLTGSSTSKTGSISLTGFNKYGLNWKAKTEGGTAVISKLIINYYK